ncbi:MAG TPA: hypothetical protein VM717_10485 [Chthoniobacterales bacterium]|nr:hypothetical protein [Chthoniobacterales bacterium]
MRSSKLANSTANAQLSTRAHYFIALISLLLLAPAVRAEQPLATSTIAVYQAARRARNCPMLEDLGLMEFADGNFAARPTI